MGSAARPTQATDLQTVPRGPQGLQKAPRREAEMGKGLTSFHTGLTLFLITLVLFFTLRETAEGSDEQHNTRPSAPFGADRWHYL